MSGKQLTSGNDSFLDIVANLVGVMIILVVVVGAKATSEWIQTKEDPSLNVKIESLKQEIHTSVMAARKQEVDNHQLEQKIRHEAQLGQRLAKKRQELLVRMQKVESEIEIERDKLDSQQKLEFDQARQVSELEQLLAEVEKETRALQVNKAAPVETIEHYPTPIAKTVFSDEVHFRLAKGKISYVPMNELIQQMKSEWKLKAEKLAQSNQTRETVGPYRSYRLQYELAATDTPTRERRPGAGRSIRFKRFVMIPSREDLGESIDEALQPGSNFLQELKGHPADKTTISVWVYPDSYLAYGELKNHLHKWGYQTASWPLAAGRKISGGPEGFKTSAQ